MGFSSVVLESSIWATHVWFGAYVGIFLVVLTEEDGGAPLRGGIEVAMLLQNPSISK